MTDLARLLAQDENCLVTIGTIKRALGKDYIEFPKSTLKKRGKDYVVYNYAWLKENWQTELKVMGIDIAKEIYNKGYDDGREAIAFHYELCKEEGSIIVVPDGATNGDIIKAMFPDAEITMPRNPLNPNSCVIVNYNYNEKHYNYYRLDWWNSPYRKEQE